MALRAILYGASGGEARALHGVSHSPRVVSLLRLLFACTSADYNTMPRALHGVSHSPCVPTVPPLLFACTSAPLKRIPHGARRIATAQMSHQAEQPPMPAQPASEQALHGDSHSPRVVSLLRLLFACTSERLQHNAAGRHQLKPLPATRYLLPGIGSNEAPSVNFSDPQILLLCVTINSYIFLRTK